MSDRGSVDGLRAAERELQVAQLHSDLEALDSLVDNELLFTGPDGSVLTKQDDLTAHRSGTQVMERLEELELRVRVVGSTGVTWLLADLAGSFNGAPFAARLRYTRAWTFDALAGWRIVAAHATFVAAG